MNRFKCPACGRNQYTSCDTDGGAGEGLDQDHSQSLLGDKDTGILEGQPEKSVGRGPHSRMARGDAGRTSPPWCPKRREEAQR
jgi:hypothetical protein